MVAGNLICTGVLYGWMSVVHAAMEWFSRVWVDGTRSAELSILRLGTAQLRCEMPKLKFVPLETICAHNALKEKW